MSSLCAMWARLRDNFSPSVAIPALSFLEPVWITLSALGNGIVTAKALYSYLLSIGSVPQFFIGNGLK